MTDKKVCMVTGGVGAKEFALLEKYAIQGCAIAIMDINKELGQSIKRELEQVHHVSVFFFHGDMQSEEDRDLFQGAVREMYGGADCVICKEC